jgi:hypothetical protein
MGGVYGTPEFASHLVRSLACIVRRMEVVKRFKELLLSIILISSYEVSAVLVHGQTLLEMVLPTLDTLLYVQRRQKMNYNELELNRN